MFPPEGPSGAGATPAAGASGAAPTPTPAASGAPSSTQPFTTPADDWQAKYTELEQKYKGWSELGDDPKQIKEVVDWARQRAAEIQAGRLRPYDPASERRPEPTATPDPYAGWDDLTPREQAERQTQLIAQQLSGKVTGEAAELKRMLEEHQRVLSTQSTLFQKAMRLAVAHPEVPFDVLVAKATEIGSAGPDRLFELALEGELAPSKQKQLIEQEVQKRLAAKEQEAEAAEAARITARTTPRLAGAPKDPASLAERRQKNRIELERAVSKRLRELESQAS